MGISKKALAWASTAQQELKNQNIPLPVELILAVIDIESSGVPGLVNKKSGASGLMQVMPIVVEDYNKAHPKNQTTIKRMRESTMGPEQIRVGVWILGRFWKSAYKYLKSRLENVPIDELMKIADLFYVAGPGATRKKLDKLDVPIWSNILKKYSEWNALPHTKKAISKTEGVNFELDNIADWLEGTVSGIDQKRGAGLAILIVAAGMLLLKYFQKGKSE